MQLETVNVHALETALTVAGLNEVGRAMVQELLTAAEERGRWAGFEAGYKAAEEYAVGLEEGSYDVGYNHGFDDGFDYGDDQGYEEGYADASAIYSGNSAQPNDVVFYPECSGYEPFDEGNEPAEWNTWRCGVCSPTDETCAAVNCPEGTPPVPAPDNPFDDEFVPYRSQPSPWKRG